MLDLEACKKGLSDAGTKKGGNESMSKEGNLLAITTTYAD
jgi:hypothetical protein